VDIELKEKLYRNVGLFVFYSILAKQMKLFLINFLFILSITTAISQNNSKPYFNNYFPLDSLTGFDEIKVSKEAKIGGFENDEYSVYMYRAKRNFVNNKFGSFLKINYQLNSLNQCTCSTSCVNIDFESTPLGSVSSLSGWMISEGTNTNSCGMICCLAAATGTNSWIRATPLITSSLSIAVPNSPLGGTKVIQLNDSVRNMSEMVRLSQSFSVTSSNSIFDYAIFALMDGNGHQCCDQPYINVCFYDCSGSLIPLGTFSLVAPGPTCYNPTPNWATSSGLSYHTGWQVSSVDLSGYIGTCIKIEVTMADCDATAHAGYCFFDARCGPTLATEINNINSNEASINLFPNPNDGEFEIRSLNEERIILINELGQTTKTIKLSKENNYLAKVTDLPAGIYFVIGKRYRQKLIVTQ
jgi:hypothetical protein